MIIAGVISDLTGWLEDVSAEWWFLLVILGVAFLDSVIPIVPSETTVILGGVAAGAGDQNLLLVILCGAVGAWLGDNTAYLIGYRFKPLIERRAARREKTAKRLEWATDQIHERGGLLLITARFIPGGRTALTLTCGLTHQPWPWFAAWVAVATTIWASYGAILGYVFGSTLEDHHTLAFILAFGAALSVTLIIEVVRHQRNKGKSPAEQAEEAEPA
jgi:membrane protein DedA with SNARE-associated domain